MTTTETRRVRAPLVVCIPSSDAAFRAAVAAVLDRREHLSPVELEAAVRLVYPAAIVRRRDLSAERTETWYAYRDGSYRATRGGSWADEAGVAWASFDPGTGRILAANDALVALFSRPGDRLVGRLAREFVPEGAGEISNRQLRAVSQGGETRSIGRGRRSDGSEVLVEWVARVIGDEIHAWYRPIGVAIRTEREPAKA